MFSRKDSVELELFNLNDLFTSMHKMLDRLIGEDIRVESDLRAEPDIIKADRSSVNQVIMNLVINARDAMPSGGSIMVATENVQLRGDDASRNPESRPGDFICLSVQDSGKGMNRDEITQIFEPFYTTKERGKGTGLGLAVVYGIVKQHKGWIEVESSEDSGTLFRVILPSVINEELNKKERKIPSHSNIEISGTVLLVEDEEPVRRVARRMLEKYNFTVFEADCIETARRVYKERKGRFDLIFSDNVLSDGSGVSLIEELKEMNRDLKVIITSGYTDEKSGLDVIRARHYRFVHKPYSLQDLLSAIQDVMSGPGKDGA